MTSYKQASSKIQKSTSETYIPLHKHTYRAVNLRFKIWLKEGKKHPKRIVEK